MFAPSKKPKLNVYAKALFICHAPRTVKKYRPPVEYFLKFPKISKEFLFAANSYRIYSLSLGSFCSYSQRYSVELEITNGPSNGRDFAMLTVDFEGLKNLSKWLHIEILNAYLSSHLGPENYNKEICAFRRIWSKIYPDAKINFINKNIQENSDTMLVLFEELSGRLHNFNYRSEPLMKTQKKLTLNKCVLNDELNIVDFKKLMQKEHKIKKLKFSLCRIDESDKCWEKPIPLQEHLNDFPTNFALKELKIEHHMQFVYEMQLVYGKSFDVNELVSLLEFFPNLTRFDLKLHYFTSDGYEEAIEVDFKKDVKEPISNALNFIREFRLILAQKMSMVKLEVSYEFSIMDAAKKGFGAFEDWAKALPDHPELSNVKKIGPISKPAPYVLIEFRKGQYYKICGNYGHAISLEWEHKNFIGKIYMFIEKKSELREDSYGYGYY